MSNLMYLKQVESSSEEEITLDDIIENKMPTNILREFLRFTLEGIKNEDDLIFE